MARKRFDKVRKKYIYHVFIFFIRLISYSLNKVIEGLYLCTKRIDLAVKRELNYKYGGGDPKTPIVPEIYDTYSASTYFFMDNINMIQGERNVLSMGGMVRYIVPLMGMVNRITHCSMIEVCDESELMFLFGEGKHKNFIIKYGDFFDINPGDESLENLNIMVSHVALHCMNDTRYGNEWNNNLRTYKFVKQLMNVCPNMKHVLVSVPVYYEDVVRNNNTLLDNEKFIKMFEDEGFILKDKLYDKHGDYKVGERFTYDFPVEFCKNERSVVGNFYFYKN